MMINASPVIASLAPIHFNQFMDCASGYEDILSAVRLVDPAGSYAELVEQINRVQAPILLTGWGSVPLEPNFLSDCPSIRYVCHLTGEMRWLLPRSLIEAGLLVTNWGSVISDTVAECALFLILACCRRATGAVLTMHVQRGWGLSIAPPVSLLDKRVGIHGFGNIAQQLALLLKPFRCALSAYSPPVPDALFSRFSTRRATSLEQLFENNDVIVELEALTPQTEGLVTRNLLERILPGGVFINVGRGKTVRAPDLEEVAARGKVFFGLDVFDEEPLPVDSLLRGLENVYLSPHIAGPTSDRYSLCGQHALANIRAFLQGHTPDSLIGTAEYDRMT